MGSKKKRELIKALIVFAILLAETLFCIGLAENYREAKGGAETICSRRTSSIAMKEEIFYARLKYDGREPVKVLPAIEMEQPLTEEEFATVCGMVMGEGWGRDMYIAIAQCIRNARDIFGWTIDETIEKLYGTPRQEWSALVEECVRGVFWEDLRVTDEPILFYYSYTLCDSPWHETRPYVMTIRNTRFFK